MADARARLPLETIGGLVGWARGAGQSARIAIQTAVPLDLGLEGPNAALRRDTWERLEAEVANVAPLGTGLVGWYYADPAIGVFPPRLDPAAVRHMPTMGGDLMLVVNPAADEAGFYRWMDDHWAAVPDCFGVPPDEPELPIPWNGTVRGVQAWLAAAAPVAPRSRAPQADRPGPTPAAPPDRVRIDERAVAMPAPATARAPRSTSLVTVALVVLLLLTGLGGYVFLNGANGLATPPPPAPTETVASSPTSVAVAVISTPSEAAIAATATAPSLPSETATTAATSTAPPADIATPPTPAPSSTPEPPSTATAPPPATAVLVDPTAPPTTTVAVAAATFRPGDRALVTAGRASSGPVYALTVHAEPGINSPTIGGARVGSQVTVRGGPTVVGPITWWQVSDWNNAGTLGWVSGFNLQRISP
ncbi:MAG TPA: SH3 domain-containing protein [Chloroflexia bacterium]|nr:SH3 domain-containing protein [Chloroflexia bacterium]